MSELAWPTAACPPAPVAACFHCGLPVPAGLSYSAVVDEVARPMCCAGCAAVAQTIADAGLGDYYRTRNALPQRREVLPELLGGLTVYDAPELQRTFVTETTDPLREASLALEGIRCAACVWLNERQVGQLPGVESVSVNYVTHRMRVRWDAAQIPLSRILKAVADIGYCALPFDAERREDMLRKERRTALWRLGLAAFAMMQVMMFAVPTYLAGDGEITADIAQLMRWASLLLTLPVLLISASEFFAGAWRDLKDGRAGMDVPIALGLGTAFAASSWTTITGQGQVYFDSIAMFVFLLLAARFLERESRTRAARALDGFARLLPAKADKLMDYPNSRETTAIAVASLQRDDCVLVAAGERVPADGVVLDGISETDEALVTGESRPVAKRSGDALTGGSINRVSPLVMRVTRTGEETVVAQIGRLMERALAEKPAIAQLADRAAGRFVLGLLVLTAVVAATWWISDPSRALQVVIALLVITCPCALGLATPAALTAATSRLARHGLLLTRGHALETLAQATDFVFDKTGTLTLGHPVLNSVRLLGEETRERAITLAASLEAGSGHPLGKALRALGGNSLQVLSLTNRPGAGVEGVIDGLTYRLGTPAFVAEIAPAQSPPTADSADTLVALGSTSGWIGVFEFADAPRPHAAEVIRELKAMGKRVHLLSGDTPAATEKIAGWLATDHCRGGVSPAEKLAYVRELEARGAVVAMLGDGVNDAPGLAGAQVSVAMGGGTDVAQAAADVVLLSSDLRTLIDGLNTARQTRRIIRQNLTWALAYNLLAIPLAAAGWVTPWLASVGMSASSALVVLNALRLARDSASTRAISRPSAVQA